MRIRLAEGERVIAKTRAHPAVLARPVVVLLLLVPATTAALGWLSRDGLPEPVSQLREVLPAATAVLGALLVLWWCAWPAWRWIRTWTYLTNRRVVLRRGLSSRRQWEVPLVLVQAVYVRQSLMRRGSGAGNLSLATAQGSAVLRDMPDVHRLRDLVYDAIEALPRTVMFDGVELETEQHMDWTGNG
ncbi:PH domain-containing protein [Zafaria sp. Z1313]|uniref:PH domain-containing protein n=1 Tax=unclassified Zafaria TaxID=2828765 RepID=UPI002E75BBF8|nr:PH domain-containing protein [Zafaria sp. J156]MEE1619996.1 PH domain-containing protein [Zafaria sp. J156]